jgi:hypothetical protein
VDALMGGRGGSGYSGASRTGAAGRAAAAFEGIRRAGIRDLAHAPSRSLDAFHAAYAGASRSRATALATGRAVASGNRTPFPAIHIHLAERRGGGIERTLNDGNHRLAAARAAGATHIRAVVRYYPRRGNYREREMVIRI